MKKAIRQKLIMSFGNNKIKLEMVKTAEHFIIQTSKYFLGIIYSKRTQHFDTFDEAEDKFSELKNEIKLMSLMR